MGLYNIKTTDYGRKKRQSFYGKSVAYGANWAAPPTERQRYAEMSAANKRKSDIRREHYYKRKVVELTEIALMNEDLTTAVTLTFRESITSYDLALAKWQLFVKRLRHSCPNLKYICVWEFQKKRSEKEQIESGGVLHFHCLMNIGYIEHRVLEKLWGNGFVWIDSLGNEKKRFNAVRYTVKYITKEVCANVSDRGRRYIFTSNNLKKPQITLAYDNSYHKEDAIFAHLEDMIKDGEYDLHNSEGNIINHVDYIEYRTK